MSAGEALNANAHDHEGPTASEVERAPVGDMEEHMAADTALGSVAIALRKVALVLDEAA